MRSAWVGATVTGASVVNAPQTLVRGQTYRLQVFWRLPLDEIPGQVYSFVY